MCACFGLCFIIKSLIVVQINGSKTPDVAHKISQKGSQQYRQCPNNLIRIFSCGFHIANYEKKNLVLGEKPPEH